MDVFAWIVYLEFGVRLLVFAVDIEPFADSEKI